MEFRASVFVARSPAETWDVWTDAARFPQWQGMVLAVRELSGPVTSTGTEFVLDHGPKMQRRVRVVAAERPVRHSIEQSGFGVQDHSTTTFEPEGHGTRVTIVVIAHPNRLMGLLARFDRRSRMERELQAELDRFARVAERVPTRAIPGTAYLVRANAYRRRVIVTGVDGPGTDSGDVVHIRLLPGWWRADDPGTAAPKLPSDLPSDFRLWPIAAPMRSAMASGNDGLPFLLRDGGHGVEHVALAPMAWADAAPTEDGEATITERDRAWLAARSADDDPIVGIDPTMDLAPVVTLRLGVVDDGEVWTVAKILRNDVMRVHLMIDGTTWPERPDAVDPGLPRLTRMSDEAIERGDPPDLTLGIGHVPLQRFAFDQAKPRFVGLTTLRDRELEGYRMWREAKGGSFDTLQWILDWDPEANRPLDGPDINYLDD